MKAGQEAVSDVPLLQTPSQKRPREPDDGKQTICFMLSNILRTRPAQIAGFNSSKHLQTLLMACHGQPANGPNWMFLWTSGTSLACPGGFWVISVVTTAARAMAPLTSTQTR